MRTAKIERNTKETMIKLELNLDGTGSGTVTTNIGFFDHVLMSFSFHSLCDLKIEAIGDLYVDTHHLVEDVGIVLGQAIKEALKDKKGINRFASCIIPMDEALVLCAIDLSTRGYLEIDKKFKKEKIGDFETDTVEEFFRALAMNAGINLHFQIIRGENYHHIIECMFKAFARSLKEAVSLDKKMDKIPSTKAIL